VKKLSEMAWLSSLIERRVKGVGPPPEHLCRWCARPLIETDEEGYEFTHICKSPGEMARKVLQQIPERLREGASQEHPPSPHGRVLSGWATEGCRRALCLVAGTSEAAQLMKGVARAVYLGGVYGHVGSVAWTCEEQLNEWARSLEADEHFGRLADADVVVVERFMVMGTANYIRRDSLTSLAVQAGNLLFRRLGSGKGLALLTPQGGWLGMMGRVWGSSMEELWDA
jgi:hypothetical protein